ncbi:putative amidohydrolase 1 protein [Phaeoacremonium minimum UCRPA7]|uniref:dihydropyrimidinase n=1 Tax=Phaeoacremonium minimum (strain UCR-PA7) TaxID=1286976 RepID=R8BGE9_PHAM7|nr:putative amidohydrolase 1 protein [Phaeoacremonium minimum UCRPA7]EON98405.1 putative amidohydrolase 1 protein [Phaeoacremonium minimum UCRPA7]
MDVIIKNGRIVTASEVLPFGLDIGIKDGKIACIGRGLEAGESTEVIDAEGAYVTPGGVDSHVHIEQDNSPTGDNWECGSRSALAGGNTTVIAFASQKRHEESIWPVLDTYHKRAAGNAYCDYGFHVILTNPTEQILEKELPELVEKEGISSVKLYMTYEPMKLGDADLFNIMMQARSLGITTMIHAENSDIIEQITKRLAKAGNTSTFFHSVARPQIAETEATYRAISLAEVTDTPILLVHMSAPQAVKHVSEAQQRLLPIHAETCPHYLYLLSDRLRSGLHDCEGAKNICAPPLRHDPKDLEEIWRSVANGTFTVISSDHAPATFDHPCGKKKALAKEGAVDKDGHVHADFRDVPNGLPGIETRLPLIFDRTFDPTVGYRFHDDKIRISLPRFVELTSTNPAKLYGLGDRKGSLLPGYDADIVIWYPEEPPMTTAPMGLLDGAAADSSTYRSSKRPSKFKITNEMLHHSIDYTPFEGVEVRNWPRRVLLRGKVMWDRDGGGVVGSKSDDVGV